MPDITSILQFFTDISDPAMWRSLGWLFLGILLIVGGVLGWVKSTSVGTAVTGAVAKGAV